MNIHEYQAKAVLREFGVPVPRGVPAFTVDDAVKAAHDLGGPVWVVKAQIHAGGRGKAGGVKVVRSIEEVGREGILLATSNGRIVLELPEKADADVDLHVDNGVIRNDRNLASAIRDTNGRVRGTLGRGGIPIKLRTSNGSICLR